MVLAALWLCAWAPTWADDDVLTLARADIVLDSRAGPPPDVAAWQPQRLPDFWPESRPGATGVAWYRLRFELHRLPAEPAVFFTRLRTVGAVWVNGQRIGATGTPGVAEPGQRPQLLQFAPGLLREGPNELLLRVWVADGYLGAVSAVQLGERAVLARAYERERFIRITLVQLFCALSLTVAFVTLLVWWQRRAEAMFGCFGMAAAMMALSAAAQIGALPLSGAANEWLDVVGGYGKTLFVFLYVLRFGGWRWPRVEGLLCAGTGIMWTIGAVEIFVLNRVVLPEWLWNSWLVPTVGALLLSAMIAARRRDAESLALLAGHAYSCAAVGVGLFGTFFDGFDPVMTHLAPLIVVMGWIMARRFVRSLATAERLNAELEARVQAKHAELEGNYRRIEALTREAAVTEERGRIMRDMHDGIGAQLITALSLVERGDGVPGHVAEVLRECIDDLRLTIDSLEPAEDDLVPVLGNLRYRLEGRLRQQGIALEWALHELPPLAGLTPRYVLHVLRILQEAFTNILKHAQASRIQVHAKVEARRVAIVVRDDGHGFDDGAPAPGRGLANMRSRAQAIGAELCVTPSPGGTTLSLALTLA